LHTIIRVRWSKQLEGGRMLHGGGAAARKLCLAWLLLVANTSGLAA